MGRSLWKLSLAVMGSSSLCLVFMVLLFFGGGSAAPVESTEAPQTTLSVSVTDSNPISLVSGGCSNNSVILSNRTDGLLLTNSPGDDNDEERNDEESGKWEITKEAEKSASSETTTINYMTTMLNLNTFDEENITNEGATITSENDDQTAAIEFKSNAINFDISTTELSTTLEELKLTDSSEPLATEIDLKSEPLEEVTEPVVEDQHSTASEIISDAAEETSESPEQTTRRKIVNNLENFTTELPTVAVEDATRPSLPVDKESTIREISIILLPLEDREEYDSDTDVEKIVSLFEIGGDSYEVDELKNSTHAETSSTIIDPETDATANDSAAFNAAKIREKFRSSSTAATITTTADITTTTVGTTATETTTTIFATSSIASEEPTTAVDLLTSTIVSTTSEDKETAFTTDDTMLDTLEEKGEISKDTILSETTTDIASTTPVTDNISTTTTTVSSTDGYDIIDHTRYISGNITDMVAAVQFLHYHDKASSEQCYKLVNSHWNYATNLTEENKKRQLAQTLEYSKFHKEAWKNATSFAWKSFKDVLLRRWFKSLSVLGTAALSDETLTEFNKLKAEMKNIYSTAKVCGYRHETEPDRRRKVCSLPLEPDLQRIMTKSRNYDELVHVWKSWRDQAGRPIRQKYLKFIEISNQAAHLNGFRDTGDMWRESYESVTFRKDLAMLWEQLRPLYEHLHAFVRRRLISLYGSDRIKENGPIPAHLFGNMWAQSWVSLLDISQPFPGRPSVDVTSTMEAKNMSAVEMFKISEEFFTSLGLKPMPEEFWKHSLIEKPKDREIICHASAWDFCNGKDYRIKQCTDITMEDLFTVHHEMGHIQYFLQYARQPNVFREGANPGFHEAIGDVLALSVSTPNHLKSIGLLQEVANDPEGDLNFLFRIALEKVSFLPSGYLIDLWRWGLFSGEIKPEEMNAKWWELRLKYQGICPPVKRTELDFDPGAKYHVPGNVPYIRYFVSFVIQFQFHKVLCDASGHTGPLHKCDIYRSKEAGQILSQVMELGSSEHWSEAMKIMTGGATNKMDASPILEYFEPLLQYLIEQNRNETIGWKSEDPTTCP